MQLVVTRLLLLMATVTLFSNLSNFTAYNILLKQFLEAGSIINETGQFYRGGRGPIIFISINLIICNRRDQSNHASPAQT